ncbi:MAG: hypothetical protein ABSB89_07915 [Candidatus Bathyarchaeia archaeon]|jgi:hypothetical protein
MNDFVARQVTRSHVLSLNGGIVDVFGLFDPIGEKKWSEDWNPSIIFPPSGIRQGTVFETRGMDGKETIWVISTFDRNNPSLTYTTVTPGFKVTIIEVKCEPYGTSHTKARVTYTVTSLSEKGNQYLDSFSEDYYCEMMTHWKEAINHYLQHGYPLAHH